MAAILRGQIVRVAGVVMVQNNRVVTVPRYASDLTVPRTTATATRRSATPQIAPTRRNTPTLSPPTRTPMPRPRSELSPANRDLARVFDEMPLDAQTVAVVGGSTSMVTGCACLVLALALWQKK
jgi:hypothetical protein